MDDTFYGEKKEMIIKALFERDCETGEFTDKLLIDGVKKNYNYIWEVFKEELDANSLLWGRPCEPRDLCMIAKDTLNDKKSLQRAFDETCMIVQFEKSENEKLREKIKDLEITREHFRELQNKEVLLKIKHNEECCELKDQIIKVMEDHNASADKHRVDVRTLNLEIVSLKKVNRFIKGSQFTTKKVYMNLVAKLNDISYRYISRMSMKDLIYENFTESMEEAEKTLFQQATQ